MGSGRAWLAAKAVEHQLDRHLANHFNALDYLRTDEIGLSRIVADLLDPDGPYGQGACFLALFLVPLIEQDRLPRGSTFTLDESEISVSREYAIQVGQQRGRLDIFVEIRPVACAPFCVENRFSGLYVAGEKALHHSFLEKCLAKACVALDRPGPSP